jgi:hypothetical protein
MARIELSQNRLRNDDVAGFLTRAPDTGMVNFRRSHSAMKSSANMKIWTRFGDNGANKFVARVAVFALSMALLMAQSTLYAQDSAKRVLFLLSYNISYPGIMLIGQGAINRLTDRSPEKLELLSVRFRTS